MKTITVYADFDFLASPQEIGKLGYEHVRGNDHFVFEYSRSWLKQHGGIILSGDLMNIPAETTTSLDSLKTLFLTVGGVCCLTEGKELWHKQKGGQKKL